MSQLSIDSGVVRQSAIGIVLVRTSALYMMTGIALGIVMAVTHDFSLLSVHSHILLLGWAAMSITGLVYILVPRSVNSGLASVHFWAHQIGVPVMMSGLVMPKIGLANAEPVVGIGSAIFGFGMLAFTGNLFVSSSTMGTGGVAPNAGDNVSRFRGGAV